MRVTMPRQAGNWLRAYEEYTKESESPDSYHLWTGLSVLSSACRRNVWLEQNLYRLYPNMYTVLVGPPGKVGKSTSIRLGRRIMLSVEDIMLGADSLTREELIEVLARSKNKATGQSAITLHSTELSSLIEPSGIQMVQFLIDIFDSDDKWRYSTKNSGKAIIDNPHLTILAGTYPGYLADEFPTSIVGNGFAARTIFVYEDSPRFANPFPKPHDLNIVNALCEDLIAIAQVKGEFVWDSDAHDLYEKQYMVIFNTTPDDYRLEDFHYRKKIHLLKVAMLLSIAESDDRVLRVADLETAWTLLAQLEKTMVKTFASIGKYLYATDQERIITDIYTSGGMTAQEIFHKNRAVGDHETLSKIIFTAEQAGRIYKVKDDEGVWWYRPVA